MKKLFSILLVFVSLNTIAQEAKSDTCSKRCSNFGFNVSTDFASRYLWRGQQLSGSPCIQPTIALSYKNLTLTSWSSYTVSKENLQEFDFYLAYKIKNFTLAINDYFVPDESLASNKYFILNKDRTTHFIEGQASFKSEKFPLGITLATYFYGPDHGYGFDAKKDSTLKGYYSSYAELNYDFKCCDNSFSAVCGFTPWAGYYGNTLGVINLGFTAAREVEISDKFTLPIKGQIMVNPQSQNVWAAVYLTIQ